MASRPPTEAPTAALCAIVRERRAPAAMKADLAAYLREHGVDGDDLATMVGVGADRILVYRRLVHNRMRGAIGEFIPRSVARLGPPRFRQDFEIFVEQRASHSFYLRDVPSEFVEWVADQWLEEPDVPDYLADLARHELLDFDIRNDHRGGQAPTGVPLALDRPLQFDGAARLIEYAYEVHRLPKAVEDRSTPTKNPTRLLVYRDDRYQTRYLELTTFAAALLHGLLGSGLAVQSALQAAATALGETLDDEKLGAAAVLLADLSERGVCLGAA